MKGLLKLSILSTYVKELHILIYLSSIASSLAIYMDIKMSKDVFIGMGNNPQGPDIPVGFGVLLEGEPTAKENFGNLTVEQKYDLVQYMQQAKTGQESEARVVNAVQMLKKNQFDQLLLGTQSDRYF